MRAPLLLAVAALALGVTPSAHAHGKIHPAAKAFPFPMDVHTLPNGVRLVLVPYDSPGLVAYYTLMRVGSRNEPEAGRSGYAHFFEHMMFRGTPTHPADEYNSTIAKLGLATNAFTSEDMTIYHAYGPSKALPSIIELESDRFQHLQYDEEQFKTEAGAILGEYAKSASNPEQILFETLAGTAFTKHTYRHTTIGYLADIKAMPSGFDYSREFFKRYYTPDNATVIVVGDFDKAATLALLTKAYAPWKGKLNPATIAVEPPQTAPRAAHVEWKTPTLSRLVLAWHTPGAADLSATAVQELLSDYLFGVTSPLYQDLVIKRQIVDRLGGGADTHRDPSLFAAIARVKKPSDIEEVTRTITAEIAKLAGGDVDAARLDSVRSNLKYDRIMHYDTADHIAVALAVATAETGDLEFINKESARIEKIKPVELVAFAKKWLVDDNRTTITLTTEGAK
ncbi:MAG TPA: pitrilysin family protein [Polyangia bacterium]|nr:pitrilysin family protein [Polyangia bacterium]